MPVVWLDAHGMSRLYNTEIIMIPDKLVPAWTMTCRRPYLIERLASGTVLPSDVTVSGSLSLFKCGRKTAIFYKLFLSVHCHISQLFTELDMQCQLSHRISAHGAFLQY
jgi:hypothetical protein